MDTHKESTDVNKPYYSATLAHQIQTPQCEHSVNTGEDRLLDIWIHVQKCILLTPLSWNHQSYTKRFFVIWKENLFKLNCFFWSFHITKKWLMWENIWRLLQKKKQLFGGIFKVYTYYSFYYFLWVAVTVWRCLGSRSEWRHSCLCFFSQLWAKKLQFHLKWTRCVWLSARQGGTLFY